VTRLAATVAAHGLPSRHTPPRAPLPDDEFDQLLAQCEDYRLIGFLGFAVGAAAWPATAGQRHALEGRIAAWSVHALRAERLVLRASALLFAEDIRSRVLEGVALAHTAYAQPELRVFADVDLLVPGPDLARAVAVLGDGLGAERVQPEPRPGFDARVGTAVPLRVGHLGITLHRVVVEDAFGLTVQADDLFAPPYRFPLGGYELEALPMPQRLLHAASTAAVDRPARRVSLRDVAQLVLREHPNLVDVLLMARAWRCEAALAKAVTTAWDALALEGRPRIVEWADNFAPDRLGS
jgi:hypothetical protein